MLLYAGQFKARSDIINTQRSFGHPVGWCWAPLDTPVPTYYPTYWANNMGSSWAPICMWIAKIGPTLENSRFYHASSQLPRLIAMANQQQPKGGQATSPAPQGQGQAASGGGGGVEINRDYLKSIPAAFKAAEFVSSDDWMETYSIAPNLAIHHTLFWLNIPFVEQAYRWTAPLL